MSLFSWLFSGNKKKIRCPRCVGKGHVDEYDIKRLHMELKWIPGNCAYCNGSGKVVPDMVENVAVDEHYLTVDLTDLERMRLINKDPEAIMRAVSYSQRVEDIIEDIAHLYFEEKLEVEAIAEYLLRGAPEMEFEVYLREKQHVINYINQVIQMKR